MKFPLIILLVSVVNSQTIPAHESNPKFLIAPTVGFAYRTGRLSDDLTGDFREYAKSLKSGYSLGLDLAYYIKPEWGLGAKFIQFNSMYTFNLNGFNPDGSSTREKATDKIKIGLLGPAYYARMAFPNDKHALTGNLSIGYMYFSDTSTFRDDTFKIKGGNLGTTFDF